MQSRVAKDSVLEYVLQQRWPDNVTIAYSVRQYNNSKGPTKKA